MPLYAPDGTPLPDDIVPLDQAEAATLAGAAGSDRLMAPDGSALPEGAKVLATEDTGPGKLESFARGALSGATFGFEDNLGLADKAKQEAAQQANPWTSFAGEMAGSLAPMVAAGPAGAAIKGTGMAAKVARGALSTLTPAKEITTVGKAALEGSKLGASYGALSGAGHADSPDTADWTESLLKRAQGAGGGALVGALVGAPLGVAGHGLMSGVGAIANRTMPSLADVLVAAKTTELQGIRDIVRHMGYDNITIEQLQTLGQRLKDPQTRPLYEGLNLLEALEIQPLQKQAGGEFMSPARPVGNLNTLAQDSANIPGKGLTEARQAFQSRKQEMRGKMQEDVENLTDPLGATYAETRLDDVTRLPSLVDAATGAGGEASHEATLAANKLALNKRYERLRTSKPLIAIGDGSLPPELAQNPIFKNAMEYAYLNDVTRAGMNKASALDQPAPGKLANPGAPELFDTPWSKGKLGQEIVTLSPDNILDMHHSIATAAKPPMGKATQESLYAGTLKNHFSKWVDNVFKGHEDLRTQYAIYKQMLEAEDIAAGVKPTTPGDHKGMTFFRDVQEKLDKAYQKLTERTNAFEANLNKVKAGENVTPTMETAHKRNIDKSMQSVDGYEATLNAFRRVFGNGLKGELAAAGEEKMPEVVRKWLRNEARFREIMGREADPFLQELRAINGRDMGKKLALAKGGDDHAAMRVFDRAVREGDLETQQAFREAWGQSIKSLLGDVTRDNTGSIIEGLLTQNGQLRILKILGDQPLGGQPSPGQQFIEKLINYRKQNELGAKLYGGPDTAYKQNRLRASGALNDAITGIMNLRPMAVWRATQDLVSQRLQRQRADQTNRLFAQQGPDAVGKVIDTIVARNQLANTGKTGSFVTTDGTKVTFNTSLSPLGPFVSTLPGSYDKGRKRQP